MRVLVVGNGGSGKTWLASRLADVWRVPAIHLDLFRYDETGRQRSDEAFETLTADALSASDAWVCDGNYLSSLSFRAARANTIVFLDVPWFVCLGSIVWRHVRFKGRRAEDARHADRLNWSFISYVATYGKRMRPKVLEVAASSGADVVVLRSRRAVVEYLAGQLAREA